MRDFDYYLMMEREAYEKSLKEQANRRTRMERRRDRIFNLWLSVILAILVFVAMAILLRSEPHEAKAAYEPATQTQPQAYAAPRALEKETQQEPAKPATYRVVVENATVTHYCICKRCCGKSEDHPAYGITASGRKAEPYYSIAVDPAFIELGSTVYLDFGDGVLHEYRADDTGSAITGAKIDVCVSGHEEALELGVKTAAVYVRNDV